CNPPKCVERSCAITTPQCAKCARVVASECAMSPNDSSGLASKCAASWRACACSPLVLLADSTNGSAPQDTATGDSATASLGLAALPAGSAAGGSSRMTC